MKFTPSVSFVGLFCAVIAYVTWGFAPLYFKHLEHIPPIEIMSHRAIWSTVFLVIIVLLIKRWPILRAMVAHPKTLSLLILSSLFIGCNWLLYIWAINNHHLLAASLGYYINPLVTIALAVIFLKERLSLNQSVAIALAGVGVAIQIFLTPSSPWVSLGLAFSFGFYALIRKYISVDALSGLLIETFVLSFFAIYFLFSIESQTGNLFQNGWYWNVMLMSAGIVTTIPLLFYAEATVRINLSVLGFLQYIAPTLMWFIAIFLFHEPFSNTTLLSFVFIWLGLIWFTLDGVFKMMHDKKGLKPL